MAVRRCRSPADARSVRVGGLLGRFQLSGLPSQIYIDNISLVHLTADPPAPTDRFANAQLRGQDMSGHVQVRVEVVPNGNYLLHTRVLRAQGHGTFCVGFGFDVHDTSVGCVFGPWTFSVSGVSKDPLTFAREWTPVSLPCVVAFRDVSTLTVIAQGRLNFAGCTD